MNLTKNTTFYLSSLAIQKALSFFYFILVARGIGVENTGKYSFALSFTTIFAMFLDLGLTQILIRESARDKQNAQKYLANVLAFKLAGSVVVYGLVVLLVNLLGYPPITRYLVYVSGFVMLLDSFSLSFYGVLRGHHNLKFESFGVIINQTVVLISGFIILQMKLGVVVLMGAYLLGSLFNFVYASALLKKKYQILTKFSWDKVIMRTLFRLALPFAIAGLFSRLYSSMDTILLSKLVGDKAVGIYSVASKIIFALQVIALAFSASLYPAFSHYFTQAKDLLAKTFVKSMVYLAILAVPLSIGGMMLADKIIGSAFGAPYGDSIRPLQILLLALILIFLCFPLGAMLNACDRQARNTAHLGIVAGFNIVLNLILIPKYSYNGAAIAALFSYILLFILDLAVVEQIINYDKKYLAVSFGKIVLSCLAMAGLIVILKDRLHFILVIALAGLIYAAILYLTGGIKRAEIKELTAKILSKS